MAKRVGLGLNDKQQTLSGMKGMASRPPVRGDMHVATLHVCKSCMELHLTSSATRCRLPVHLIYTQQDSQVCSDSNTPCKVPHITPTFLPSGKHVEMTCFFCNKPGDDLCQFITFQLDQLVCKK